MSDFADPNLFRSILEQLHTAVYVVGRDGKIVFWNDGAERITGYLRRDVIGRVCADNFLGETDGNEIAWWGDRLPVTVSAGGTVVKAGDSPEAIVIRAEHALRDSIGIAGNCSTVRNE
jgi:PAS domain-containing protein